MRVLLDMDVLLDFFLDREPFLGAARAIMDRHEKGQFEGFVSAASPPTLFYLARRARGNEGARQFLAALLDSFRICPVNHGVLANALRSPITDFEEAVQHESAVASGVELIVTRNLGDFRAATLVVLSPTAFLARLVAVEEEGGRSNIP